MSKGDKEAFIVKFVEGKGPKTEYAVKAYEVNSPTRSTLSLYIFLLFVFDCIWLLWLLKQAILELQSEKYLKTIKEEDVLQMDQKDKSLFVFSSFTSSAFLHCKKVWINVGTQLKLDAEFRSNQTLTLLSPCFICSLAAELWVRWWCCTACSISAVSPKQRSPSTTWPWLTSLFPAPAWTKQHGSVHCVSLIPKGYSNNRIPFKFWKGLKCETWSKTLLQSVCLTLQTEVMDLVQLMGGRVYLDLNVSVTHLIAGEVGSKKYLVAASLGKPILLSSWVKACWEKSQDRYVLWLT